MSGKANCLCCEGRGVVEAASGEMRPCSRCRADDNARWFHERRPEPARTRWLRLHERVRAQYSTGERA